jgi:hypothetical protein
MPGPNIDSITASLLAFNVTAASLSSPPTRRIVPMFAPLLVATTFSIGRS